MDNLVRPWAADIRIRVGNTSSRDGKSIGAALVLAEFAALHAGNVVRFGIRPLEYSAWLGR